MNSFIAETGAEPEQSQTEWKGRHAGPEKSLLYVKRESFQGFLDRPKKRAYFIFENIV